MGNYLLIKHINWCNYEKCPSETSANRKCSECENVLKIYNKQEQSKWLINFLAWPVEG